MSDTLDESSSVAGAAPPIPAIVMVASQHKPAMRMLQPTGVTLGRALADDPRMSEDHATVSWERGGWTITDLDSHNGTHVEGRRIEGTVRAEGDVTVRLGHTVFVLVRDGRGHPATSGGDAVLGPEIQRAYDAIRTHAKEDTLLVHGESGAGKELAARQFHASGPRAGGPFVAINCAAIPEGVAERLLFGARKGAYSGATDAIGHFQAAHGGTLFLDEVADLDPQVQAKLLRVLETREVVPVGASAGIPIDLGIVAACHRELRAAVAEKRFRDDLYYRIARTTIDLPPLRARKIDLARLVQKESGALAVHAKLLEACLVRPWPGNIRELRAAMRQATNTAVAAGRDIVRVEDLAPHAGQPFEAGPAPVEHAGAPRPVGRTPDRAEIERALAQANGVVSVAARALDLHRTQLYRLMAQLDIAR